MNKESLLKFYSWNGRLNRSQYFVIIILLAICCCWIATILRIPIGIASILLLFVKIPSDIKRIKDIGKSNTPIITGILLNLTVLIPIIGLFPLIYLIGLFLIPGIPYANKYGFYNNDSTVKGFILGLAYTIIDTTEKSSKFFEPEAIMEIRYFFLSELKSFIPACLMTYHDKILQQIPVMVLGYNNPNRTNLQYYKNEYYNRISIYTSPQLDFYSTLAQSKKIDILIDFINKAEGIKSRGINSILLSMQ